jgi:RNA polymerase sigma-70 factor (ECF subfamily)
MLNEKSFEEFFHLYYKPLCYYARKYKLDHFESEEVVQQVFLKLWEIRENLSIKSSVSAYLYRAVQNQSINLLKQKSSLYRNKEEYQSKIEHAQLFAKINEENGASAMMACELEQQINQAIEDLPKKCQEIFRLSRQENLSIKEIAEQLNISSNTVQKQISIAIAKLREILKHYITVLWLLCDYFL